MLNSPMLSIFQHFHAIPLRSPLISLRSKWRLTGFSRRFTPKNPVRLHNPFGELPRWGAKNVLPLNLIALLSSGSILGTLTYCKIFFPLFFLERLYAKIIRLCRKKKALCRYFFIESNISLGIMRLSCFFGVFVKVKEDGGLWVIFL